MDCSLKTVEETARCLSIAKDWIELAKPFLEAGLGLLGIGSAVSIGVLTWFLKKSRKDIEAHQRAENTLRSSTKEALDARQSAEERERSAVANFEWTKKRLEASRGPADAQSDLIATENVGLRGKLELLRSSFGEDDAAFWARVPDPAKRLADYEKRLRDSIPVLMFANQKGGVGKTTLATNLAAYFAGKGERVLLIDLDYQGSATALMLAQSNSRPDDFPSLVDLLFADKLNELWQGTAIQNAYPNLDYVPCWYSFQKLERRLEYLWALDETEDDVRYRLAGAVLSPYVQNTYTRVIIDAPPRMTTGFVNGICASTHLFVPTVMDRVSAVAVGTFADQFKKLSDAANPVIEFSGIIGTMTPQRKASQQAVEAVDRANAAVKRVLRTERDFFLRDATMARTIQVSYSTEDGIAYLQADANTREMFEAIGQEVAKRAPKRSK